MLQILSRGSWVNKSSAPFGRSFTRWRVSGLAAPLMALPFIRRLAVAPYQGTETHEALLSVCVHDVYVHDVYVLIHIKHKHTGDPTLTLLSLLSQQTLITDRLYLRLHRLFCLYLSLFQFLN